MNNPTEKKISITADYRTGGREMLNHSVMLDITKCRGCTNCIKHCPTEAIRVREGHAQIENARCIDCGECIRVCQYKAKKAIYDRFEDFESFRYKIALPAPALYGQFEEVGELDVILSALVECGFDEVFEVSRAAEIVSEYTRKYLEKAGSGRPVISSACPVIIRLIGIRYPLLLDRLLPVLAPIEVAARIARNEALAKHPELTDEDIAVLFLSPCPAKVSYVKNPLGTKKSAVNGALSIGDFYFKLLSKMKHITEPRVQARSGIIGISWAGTGGEASALFNDKYLAADGIENVIKVLDEIDNGNIRSLDFVELNACNGGCVGGVLNIENPYIAKARLQTLRRYLPVSLNRLEDGKLDGYEWDISPDFEYAAKLSEDRHEAMRKMKRIVEITNELPGIDCGSCGAPTCRALAEDIVNGKAKKEDCVLVIKELLAAFYHSRKAEDEKTGSEKNENEAFMQAAAGNPSEAPDAHEPEAADAHDSEEAGPEAKTPDAGAQNAG